MKKQIKNINTPEQYLQKYKDSIFPLEYKNNIYTLIDGSYVELNSNKNKKCNKYYLCFKDQDGYKFCMELYAIKQRMRNNGDFTKFFYHNKFTKDNINHYLKTNNTAIVLIDEITMDCNAHTYLRFWNEHEKCVKKYFWFNIYKDVYKYTWNYYNELEETRWKKENIKTYCIELQKN